MTKFRSWILLARIGALIAVVSWIYWPEVHGGWLWDDNVYITNNKARTGLPGLVHIWLVPGKLFEYYPITETVQWFQWQLFGNNTFGYHLTNVALHVLDALLFWRLLSEFGLRFGWMGALIFAVHPMNVESVAWISELKNTLSLAPTLLCLTAFLDYENGGEQRRYYWEALVFFGIAMLCKNSVACLPFCLLLYLWWKRGRIGFGDLKTIVPFFIISALGTAMTVWAALRYGENHGSPIASAILSDYDLAAPMMLTVHGAAFFFLKYLYPFNLVPFYPPWAETPDSFLSFLQLALFGVGAWLLVRSRSRWSKTVLLGMGFFLLNLLPLIALIFVRYPYFIWSIDHSAYLPYLGLIGLTVAGFERLYQSQSARLRPLLIATILLALLPLAIFSRGYASYFVDAKGLWIYTLQHPPALRVDELKPPSD